MNTQNITINTHVNELKESFKKLIPQRMSFRRSQLISFSQMINRNRKMLFQALKKDLNKNYSESLYAEIEVIKKELNHHLYNFEDWIEPRTVPTDLINFGGMSYIKSDPLGICLIIGAWNYPINLTLIPMIGCISAGNCLLVKAPSNKYSSFSSLLIFNLIKHYLNPLAVRVVKGDREMTAALLQQNYNLIFFTGGNFVGKMIAKAAAKTLTPVILELGGKTPVILDRMINSYKAAKKIAWGRFLNAGQTCIAPDYLLIHEDIKDKFLRDIEKIIKHYYLDFPKQGESFGKIINPMSWRRITHILEKDKKYIIFGGNRDISNLHICPTILDFGNDKKAFEKSGSMRAEIFGPILPCYVFKSLTVVIQIISSMEQPLSLYIFSERKFFYNKILNETTSGSVMLNDVVIFSSNNNLPFGGIGNSGTGCYHGKYSFDTFSHLKTVMDMKYKFVQFSRYPPYGKMKNKVNSLAIKINQLENFQSDTVLWIIYTIVLNKVYSNEQTMKKIFQLLLFLNHSYRSKL